MHLLREAHVAQVLLEPLGKLAVLLDPQRSVLHLQHALHVADEGVAEVEHARLRIVPGEVDGDGIGLERQVNDLGLCQRQALREIGHSVPPVVKCSAPGNDGAGMSRPRDIAKEYLTKWGYMQTSVKILIDKAAEKCGTRYKLAQALGVMPGQVYDWEEGRKTCSPADRARIAAFAGEDAVQELVRATLENARGDLRREQLEAALGKSLRAIGGAVAIVVLAVSSLICSPADEAQASFS